MLPRKDRIPRHEIPSPKMKGFRVFSPLFSAVFYITTQNKEESRASVVVSKKTAKTAVSRNLLRRRFYSVLSPLLAVIKTPVIIVVYPKNEAKKALFSDLKTEIEKALKQAKLL